MDSVYFEKLARSNASKVVEIYNYYVTNTTASYNTEPLNEEELISYYQIENPLTKAYVIKRKADIVGFVVLKPWNAKKQAYQHTYEFTVYIKKEYCNKGIGTQAFKYVEKQACENKIVVIMAGLSFDNIGSCKLLESVGFTRCGHFQKVGKKFDKFLDLYYYQKIYPDNLA